jgi:hypothetical protein
MENKRSFVSALVNPVEREKLIKRGDLVLTAG